MSQTDKKNKLIKKNRFIIGMFIFISIYFLINLVPTMFSKTDDTMLPQVGSILSKTNAQGFVIKKETLYFSDGSGKLDTKIEEGTRVPAGIEIASLSMANSNSNISYEINQINEKINKLKETNERSLIKTENKDDNSIESFVDSIQANIKDGNYEDLSNNLNKINNDSSNEDSTLINQSLDSLNQQKDRLLELYNSNIVKYFSREAGIVSYEIDGFEDVFIPKEFENYTYDKLIVGKNINKTENNVENVKNTSFDVSSGQAIFKIINNFEWYMALKIDDFTDINQYEVGNSILVELLDSNAELEGRIIKINTSGNKAVIIVKFNDYLHNNYNLRFPIVNIIHYRKEGLKIPTKVIIEKDGKKGVLVKDISGIVIFKQISILGEVDEYTIIDKGNNNGYIEDNNGKSYKTVTLYDEIFLDPSSVLEGEILR
jgi:putative membrane fusion protein